MAKTLQPKNFETLKHFPGEDGNAFDTLIRIWEIINHISAPLYLMALFGIALLRYQSDWLKVFILAGFFLSDWVILRLLPVFRRSFGPANSASVMLAILRVPFTFLPFPISVFVQAVGSILVIFGFWLEPQQLQLVQQHYVTNKIPPGKKVRLLHITDIHVEELTQRELRILETIKETHPDIIVFTGDILNLSFLKDEKALRDALGFMKLWEAPHGVYMVSGSPAVDTPGILSAAVQELSGRFILNQIKSVEVDGAAIQLIGLGCTHRPHVDYPILQSLRKELRPGFNVLLYHNPDIAPLIDGDVDLYLCGHTHGGQVRLPFIGALFTASLYGRRLQAGRYAFGNMLLYISRGIGMEGAGAPRVRLFCQPEITLWEIAGR